MRRTKTNTVKVLYILTFLFVLLIFITLGQIKSYGKDQSFSEDYDKYETAYRMELKDVLKEAGYKNSGITMTKTYSDEEGLSYEVNIHLPSNINIEEKEAGELKDKLSSLASPIEGALISISFS